MTVKTHPRTLGQLSDAFDKLKAMREEFQHVSDYALTGMLERMTHNELVLLARYGYLSEHEKSIVKRLTER